MKLLKLCGAIGLSLFFFSCDNDFDIDTSPRGDFELFFEYLKEDYSYRDYHSFTMEELRQKYLPRITSSNTKEALADIILNVILNELKDPHVSGVFEAYNFSNVVEINPPDLDEIAPFFEEIDIISDTPYYVYGTAKTNRNIGYLYVRSFNSGVGGTNSLGIEKGVKKIDDIVEALGNLGVSSMIVDIRSGAGGSNYVPRYIAQRFVNKSAVYMIEEYPVSTSFKRKEWVVSPSSGPGFREGKIALLSNGLTASGGEMFTLAMLQRDNLVHIGSRSLGASGNIVDKDLSNGWNVRITNSRTEEPDGTQYFKVGITPSIIVKNVIGDDFRFPLSFEDKLIERAIKELQ